MTFKRLFSALMIVAAICTTGVFTSCSDDDSNSVSYSTIKVESSDTYRTKDDVTVRIGYSVDAEVSQAVNRTESEWKDFVTKEINKEISYEVGQINWANDELNKSYSKIFDDIYDAQIVKDCTLGRFKGISCVKVDTDKNDSDEKNPEEEEKDQSDNLDKVSVSATSTYMTKDNYAIVLSYDAELWETRVNEEKGVDEWTSFLKDVCEKVFKESVENVNWTDGKENFDNFMFGESGWGLYVANGFNGCIHESEMGVKYNCTFKIDEYPAEIVKNETLYSVSIEGVTLNNVQTQDYYSFRRVQINSCDVEYDDLGTVNEDEIKNLIISKINTEYEKYMNSVLLSERYKEYCETHEETKYRCLDFLDSELSNFESHLITIFNIENDHFTINKFELDKGINSTYGLMWLDGKQQGYTDSTVNDDWKKMWS